VYKLKAQVGVKKIQRNQNSKGSTGLRNKNTLCFNYTLFHKFLVHLHNTVDLSHKPEAGKEANGA
jgi:hypothetical protein